MPRPLARGLISLLVLTAVFSVEARAKTITVLTPDRTVELANAEVIVGNLWVAVDDLPRINDFQLKPEGACSGAICLPINREPSAGFVRENEGRTYFNVSQFARTLQQPLVAEADQGVFSFGEIPLVRSSLLSSGQAPDFALPDRTGKIVHLSDFRGKKVLLLTWASSVSYTHLTLPTIA